MMVICSVRSRGVHRLFAKIGLKIGSKNLAVLTVHRGVITVRLPVGIVPGF
jgi:hypothetical protein